MPRLQLEARQLQRGQGGARVEQVVAARDRQVERRARVVRVEGQDPLLAGQAVEAPVAGQRQAPRRLAEARGRPPAARRARTSASGGRARRWSPPRPPGAGAGSSRRTRPPRRRPTRPRPSRRSPGPPSSPAPGSSPPSRKRGIGADRAQRVDEHSRRGGLAVGPGDREQPLGRRTARPAARRDGSPAGRARGPARARDCPRGRRSRPRPRRPAARRRRRARSAARGRPPCRRSR